MTFPEKINTILFDLDGTLIDTAPDLVYALNKVLETKNKPPLPFEQVRPFASCGSAGLLGQGFDITPEHPSYPVLRDLFFEAYHEHITYQTTLFEGMAEVIDKIESKNLRWGVVTNKPTHLADILLNHFELTERSACLIGGDMCKHRKPAPDPLLLACKQLNTTPDTCAYVGDAERDMIAARAAKMFAVAARYGYLHPDEVPEKWDVDHHLHRPSDLLDLL